MKPSLVIVALVGLSWLPACGKKQANVTDGPCSDKALCAGVLPSAAASSAAAIAGPFKSTLLATMQSAMAEGGPTKAIEVCAGEAKTIAAAHSKGGVTIGRTSHKLRNPESAPKQWMKGPIEELKVPPTKAEDVRRESHYRLVALPDGRIGYIERLFTAPLCTTCHGNDIPSNVKSLLAARYPKDEAVGFEPNSVRGFLWIEMPGGRD